MQLSFILAQSNETLICHSPLMQRNIQINKLCDVLFMFFIHAVGTKPINASLTAAEV
jgi:hypothetical protein